MLYGAIKSLRDAAVTSVEQFDYRPIPVFSQMLSISTEFLKAVDTTTGQVFRFVPAYSLLYGCHFTFSLTNPGTLDIGIRRLFVDVVKYTEVNVLGVWQGDLGGGMRVRSYSCQIEAEPGSYECTQLDGDYDYIRLSSGEMEMFRVDIDAVQEGLYHLQIGLEYIIGDEIKRVESDDQIQVIGIYDPVAHPKIENISSQVPDSVLGRASEKIHIEVFIAANLLARYRVPFSSEELRQEIERHFGDTRPGVQTHISAHCVANAPKNAAVVSNYLWRLPDGRLRPFNPAADQPHPSREDARTQPDVRDVPVEYRHLLSQPQKGEA